MTDVQIKSYKFRHEREASWRELEDLVRRAEKNGVRQLSSTELFRLPVLYRATVSSLSVARSISLDRNALAYLESLSARAYFFVYGARTHLFEAMATFFTVRFPAAVRSAKFEILIAGVCLLMGVVAGFFAVLEDASWFYTFVSDAGASGRTPASSTSELRKVLFDSSGGSLDFASYLFSHNAQIGLWCFALGFALGIPVVVLMFYNGVTLGAFIALYASRGLAVEFLGWILIHGVTELLACIICAGAGLVIGRAVIFPGRHTRLDNLARKGRLAGQIAIGGVAMLFIAALLEGFARETITDTAVRYAIAFGSLTLWGWYFICCGRRSGRDDVA
jgi:uncharacterized membrane protein SpoIIM required for sporulation